jgi:hypothetical protein
MEGFWLWESISDKDFPNASLLFFYSGDTDAG